jgi:hypothetical protein
VVEERDFNFSISVDYRHVKDVLILTCSCQVLSLVSRYFWLLWLLVRRDTSRLLDFVMTASSVTRNFFLRVCINPRFP